MSNIYLPECNIFNSTEFNIIDEKDVSDIGEIPSFTLRGIGQVAIKCEQSFDIIILDEHGYHNAFVELGNELSDVTYDALHQLGISVLVYFTDVYGTDFDTSEAECIAERYCIRLCEINLPFKVKDLDKWDEFQWCLFDKRITQALSLLGVRNEKYQA